MSTPQREQLAERVAGLAGEAVRQLILSGQQGTQVHVPELDEIITIERQAGQ